MGLINSLDKFLKKINPFTKSELKLVLKDLIQQKHNIKKETDVGKICFFDYAPKDKKHLWDRKPLILVLDQSKNYVLGLNFHWIRTQKRVELIEFILKLNIQNEKLKTPLTFTYTQLKPFLSAPEFKKCVHVYIRNRMGYGVSLKSSYLLEAAKLDLAVFSKG